MSISYNIFPINEVQTNKKLEIHVQTFKIIGNLNLAQIENKSRFPTREEVFDSIGDSELEINSENRYFDEFELSNGNEVIVHSLNVNEPSQQFGSDLTMKYTNEPDKDFKLRSLFGIQSDLRILVKVLACLTKKCGSFLILNPYEGYFIDKEKSFSEIWAQITEETNYKSNE